MKLCKTFNVGNLGLVAVAALLLAGLAAALLIRPPATAQEQGVALYDVRLIELAELGLSEPIGLAFSPADDALLVATNDGQVVAIDRLTEKPGNKRTTEPLPGTLNVVFVPFTGSLYAFDGVGQGLVEIALAASSRDQAKMVADLRPLALGQVQGLTVDPASGRLFILDAGGPRIVTLSPDATGHFGDVAGQGRVRVQVMELAELAGKVPWGLAYDPVRSHLFVLSPAERLLVELSEDGRSVARYDLSAIPLVNPRGMVFAPSGDPTDDPSTTSLYVADQTATGGHIVELFFEQPSALIAPAASLPSWLVNVIDTAAWSPPSPDPTGVDYWPATDSLLVTDSEVDQLTIYQGANVYQSTLSGTLLATCTTFPEFSKEPTGVSVSPDNGHIFISDDSARKVFEIDLGLDGLYCTADDIRTSIDTTAFSSTDPEGVAYGAGSLFISDGLAREVYRVMPGLNGVFDGVPPDGDDEVTSFDTNVLGLNEPEGIDYIPDSGTLFIVSRSDDFALETTIDGVALNTIDLSFANVIAPAGVAYGPRSTDPTAKSLYISDRGVDDNQDPNENDGKIYEIAFTYVLPPPRLSYQSYLPLAPAGHE